MTGGRGQYGEVYFRIRPQERGAGFDFIDAMWAAPFRASSSRPSRRVWRETMERGIVPVTVWWTLP
jgi:elongation factor G